jgi:hypothetical protein
MLPLIVEVVRIETGVMLRQALLPDAPPPPAADARQRAERAGHAARQLGGEDEGVDEDEGVEDESAMSGELEGVEESSVSADMGQLSLVLESEEERKKLERAMAAGSQQSQQAQAQAHGAEGGQGQGAGGDGAASELLGAPPAQQFVDGEVIRAVEGVKVPAGDAGIEGAGPSLSPGGYVFTYFLFIVIFRLRAGKRGQILHGPLHLPPSQLTVQP